MAGRRRISSSSLGIGPHLSTLTTHDSISSTHDSLRGGTIPPAKLSWPKTLAEYRKPSLRRSLWELAITLALLAGSWLLILATLDLSGRWSLVLVVPASLFLVRLFMIQHDCGHGSFMESKWANDLVGRCIGVLTLTPYGYWRRTHATHHSTVGNLDLRGIGDLTTLTVREYQALGPRGRLAYRLYRHPLVMLGLGPAYLFLLQHRLPVGLMRAGWQPWVSTMGTNMAILLAAAAASMLVGIGPFLMIQLPIVILSGSIGVWLFYVQHQFEETFWEHDGDWSFHEAALHGSSHYDLPPILRWFTANIGVHHVHHLSSRIPYYRLPEVLRDRPELHDVGHLTLIESLKSVKLVLWDEKRRCLVSFKEALQAAPMDNQTA
jgi:omega-6 fatty acid desaturase (delta-12 desaturase)